MTDMNQLRHVVRMAGVAACINAMGMAGAQTVPQRPDPNNRLYNAFRTQFKPSWNVAIRDPVKLVDIGPVTDSKRSNLVLLISGTTAGDTQRKLRILHWNGNSYDTDSESVSQSVGIDTLLLGKFHPGMNTTVVPASVPAPSVGDKSQKLQKPQKPRVTAPSRNLQVLTNSGIYSWADGSLQPLFARQLPDVKQSISLDNHLDLVVVGAGEGSLPYEFTQTEMKPAVREKLSGGGFARFGIGLQPFPGSDTVNLAPGIHYVQSMWSGRNKWLIGLVRGQAAPTIADPNATKGDRLIVYTPKFQGRDKSFWETRMDDLEESWRSEPLPGHVLDVRVGDPHNDGKLGILVLTSENDDKDRRLIFFAATSAG